jgi:hypothetical protein
MARKIDTDAEIDRIRVKDQGGDPAAPAASYKYIYAKAGGLYGINSAGTVVGPFVGTTIATDPLWDAAGDLVYGTGANTGGKLTIGTAYQVLRVNAGATAPEWASDGRVFITSASPGGTTNASFTSIPATFTHLRIEFMGRTTLAATQQSVYCYLNTDTTAANYKRQNSYNYGSTFGGSSSDSAYAFDFPANNSPANSCGVGWIDIFYYAGTTFNKHISSFSQIRPDANNVLAFRDSLEWENTAAVSQIDFTCANNYAAGTIFRLYGIF